ncbi:cyclopropane-fatty-acyl-phospholipid synthase family protein [Nocardia sp. BMG51109]|uniref:SAM-dependent methyltransferase n=1 Tax=Nocardia sp. BMG51109 TaxID=1056816 RepID=UPI0004AF0D79|nr:methyltransferase domain-containing protein [Nocardia sp. BMG51109]
MPTVSYFAIVERDHEIQNPLEPAQLDLIMDYLDVTASDRVLDIGSGRGLWPVRLAAERGATVTGLELIEEFATAARRRAEANGVTERVRTMLGPAEDFEITRSYDVATCFGASMAYAGYEPTLRRLSSALVPGGRVAIGEPHLVSDAPPIMTRASDLPPGLSPDSLPTLAELAAEFDDAGFELTGIVTATTAGFDRYESLHWKSAYGWAVDNPEHPERETVLADSRTFRDLYLRSVRQYLGWSVLVGTFRPH